MEENVQRRSFSNTSTSRDETEWYSDPQLCGHARRRNIPKQKGESAEISNFF